MHAGPMEQNNPATGGFPLIFKKIVRLFLRGMLRMDGRIKIQKVWSGSAGRPACRAFGAAPEKTFERPEGTDRPDRGLFGLFPPLKQEDAKYGTDDHSCCGR